MSCFTILNLNQHDYLHKTVMMTFISTHMMIFQT